MDGKYRFNTFKVLTSGNPIFKPAGIVFLSTLSEETTVTVASSGISG
ncbi:MAG: hypothetical protein QXP91_04575 [Candidatus Methanomethylicia archaeon]